MASPWSISVWRSRPSRRSWPGTATPPPSNWPARSTPPPACGVDFVGGFTALVHKGITPADAVVMDSLPGGALPDRAGLLLGQRRLAQGRDQHGRRPPDGPRDPQDRPGHRPAARLRLRQAGHLRQHPGGQPFHGRGLHGRRRAGGRRQHRRLRARGGLQRPEAPPGQGARSSPWATWPRRSRSPVSASPGWAS